MGFIIQLSMRGGHGIHDRGTRRTCGGECSDDPLRYYERRGLLHPSGRSPAGYRIYNEESLKRLRLIRRAKEIGFTLEEIRGLLDLNIGSAAACTRVKEQAERKLSDVEDKMKALGSVKKVLKELIKACDRRRPTEECPILKTIEEENLESAKKGRR